MEYYWKLSNQEEQLMWDEEGNVIVDNELYTWGEALQKRKNSQAFERTTSPVEVCHRGGRRYEVIQNAEERF